MNLMEDFFRNIYYSILKVLPDKIVVNIENFRAYKRPFNSKNPKYFGEKIQWLKLYGNLEKYSRYVDKFLVREYVKEKIGEQYLIPLLGVYDNPEEIDYSNLPDKFVLKCNHGSGYNIIVEDKSKINIKRTNQKLRKWLKEDYYKIKREYQYKYVEKKILCEELIKDKNNKLVDYKFFCFNGNPEFFKIDLDRYSEHKVNFYDLNWNLLNIKEAGYKNSNERLSCPENFNEMIEIVKKICKEFQFVRVDLYNVDGKIYFGELTFTPASGKNPFLPLEKDLKIAERIKVE